jgi:fluoride exporter
MMHDWHLWVAIAGGGALGSLARYGAGCLAAGLMASPGGPPCGLSGAFPLGTWCVNVFGSFLMGALFVVFMHPSLRHAPTTPLWQGFLMTGVLGGFTTFSAFSLEAGLMAQQGQFGLLVLYVGSSFAVALVGLGLGMAAARFCLG